MLIREGVIYSGKHFTFKEKKTETETRPPLKNHKMKHLDWAKKYMKTNVSKVLWTDEMRVTLDRHRAAARVRRQQGWWCNGVGCY